MDNFTYHTRLSQLGITAADMPASLENLQGNARWFGLAETHTRDLLATIPKAALRAAGPSHPDIPRRAHPMSAPGRSQTRIPQCRARRVVQ